MEKDRFDDVVQEQMELCWKTLCGKGIEYAGGADRLEAFKKAAKLQGISEEAALAGMMAKHTVSVYDMTVYPNAYPIAKWNEKITDHINYLLILKAVLMEKEDMRPCAI